MPLRASEIHVILFPRIGNTTLADIQTLKARRTPAALLKGSKLGSYRKQNNQLQICYLHTPPPVMCVVCH